MCKQWIRFVIRWIDAWNRFGHVRRFAKTTLKKTVSIAKVRALRTEFGGHGNLRPGKVFVSGLLSFYIRYNNLPFRNNEGYWNVLPPKTYGRWFLLVINKLATNSCLLSVWEFLKIQLQIIFKIWYHNMKFWCYWK